MFDAMNTETQTMTDTAMNNLVLGHFLIAHPQYLPRLSAVEVAGRPELILPADALPAFGDWGVRLGLIGAAEAREVLGESPITGGEKQ